MTKSTSTWAILALCCVTLGFDDWAEASDPVYEPHPLSDAYEYESNDSWINASDLMTSNQYIMDLSVYPEGDEDWYLWTASEAGTLRVYVFEMAWGPLEVTVFGNDGYSGWTSKLSSNPYNGLEMVEFSVKSPGDYLIHIRGANGGTSRNYLLWIDGTAHDGTFNSSPQTQTITIAATEATPVGDIWPLANDYDWDLDGLSLSPHSDEWGRVEMSAAQPVMWYLPGTSIRKSHSFYYVADDGRGGRAKGQVKVNIVPLPEDIVFPGAQGFGSRATGGRDVGNGTEVRVVRSPDNDGPGTLRHALDEARNSPAASTIVFSVGGTIHLDSQLNIPSNVTLAGETAPGPTGITVYGHETEVGDPSLTATVHDVIVRHMRFRDRDRNRGYDEDASVDTFEIRDSTDVIIDHCSCAWGNDGTLEIWKSTNVTVQWTVIAETLGPHSVATLLADPPGELTPRYVSLHHNLWAHNNGRNPLVSNGYRVDVANNVVYNWGDSTTALIGGEVRPIFEGPRSAMHFGVHALYSPKANIESNYFIAGPSTDTDDVDDGSAPLQAIGQSTSNLTEVYVGRLSPCLCTNTVPNNSANCSNSNLTALDPEAPHPGENGAPLCPIRHGSAVERTDAIDWPVSGVNPYVDTTSANVAYEEVLGFQPSPMYPGAGVVLVLGGVKSLDHDVTDGRIVWEVEHREGWSKFDPLPNEVPQAPQ